MEVLIRVNCDRQPYHYSVRQKSEDPFARIAYNIVKDVLEGLSDTSITLFTVKDDKLIVHCARDSEYFEIAITVKEATKPSLTFRIEGGEMIVCDTMIGILEKILKYTNNNTTIDLVVHDSGRKVIEGVKEGLRMVLTIEKI